MTSPNSPSPSQPSARWYSSRRARAMLITVLVLVTLGLVLKGLLTAAPASPTTGAAPGKPAPVVGHYAPSISLLDLSNNSVSLSSLKGKVVALNFWYAACEPCKYEMPAFEHAYETYQSQGFVVLGVDVVDDPGTADEYVHALGVTYPIVRDVDLRAATTYQVTDTPSTYIIDRQGVIRYRIVGAVDSATLHQDLATLLPAGK